MKLKTFSILGILVVSLVTHAGPIPIYYDFSVNPGYTLTDAYLIDTEPGEAYASVIPLSINGQTNFSTGRYGSVFPNGTTYGNNFLTVIGVVANSSSTNIGVTMPPELADSFIATNASWTNYTAYLRPFGNLPDEQTIISNLVGGSDFILQNGYNYLQATNPVLQAYGQLGTVVSFDGAQSVGAFSFSLAPMLTISLGENSVTIQWLTNAAGFTLAQSSALSSGLWAPVTNAPAIVNTYYSVTLPIGTGSSFFQLQN